MKNSSTHPGIQNSVSNPSNAPKHKAQYPLNDILPFSDQCKLAAAYGHLTDAQVLSAARSGDSTAGYYLIAVRYGSYLGAAISYRYSGSELKNFVQTMLDDLWADMTQNGFKGVPSGSVGPYLGTVVKHMASKVLKAEAKHMQNHALPIYTDEGKICEEVEHAYADYAASEDSRTQILELLAAHRGILNETENYVLNCRYQEGSKQSYAEIARNIPNDKRPLGYRDKARAMTAYLIQNIHDEAIQKLKVALNRAAAA